MARSLRIPSRDRLITTGEVDALTWYYKPILGWIMRSRLRWVAELARVGAADRVLEIGYGSGIFLYELARHGRLTVAIDVHPFAAEVGRRLRADGVSATLTRGDGGALPFAAKSFDVVVIVSALEFVADAEQTLREAMRVLDSGGRCVCLTPQQLDWADRILNRLSGVEPEKQFLGGRERASRALAAVMPAARQVRRPRWLVGFAPYVVWVHERP